MLLNNYEESYFTKFYALYESFYLYQSWISITLGLSKCVAFEKAPTSISEDHEHKISISQKSISEARETFYKISETLK